jgi:undecaprenyl-diphosphatase
VSSSGHVVLVPHLFGWSYADAPADERKTFEVALHAGSAPALLLALRGEGVGDLRQLALTLAPPALAGLMLEQLVEERLGGPWSVALAQILGGVALLAADRSAERRSTASAADHLAVGFAQALALAPGLSRSGAALTAARWRGLSREEAALLAIRAAIPVTVAAGFLKGGRIAREGIGPDLRAPLAAGATAAFASALAALPLARRTRWAGIAAYRIALGLGALSRAAAERRKMRRR